MAEREEPADGTEGIEPAAENETGQDAPLDEAAAWAQIIASYGDDPAPGEGGWPAAEDLPGKRDEPGERADPEPPSSATGLPMNNGIPVLPRAFVVHAPVGPRDYRAPDDEQDDDHFVPPEPPPLPAADVTTKFAWLAVLGGPALLLLYVVTGQDLPMWALVLGVGGFLGGFVTLIARMKDPDEEDDDPHGGAVV